MTPENLFGIAFIITVIGALIMGTAYNNATNWSLSASQGVCRIGVIVTAIGIMLMAVSGCVYFCTKALPTQ